MGTILQGQGLTKDYPFGRSYNRVLNDVSLTVAEGEFLAIMGPSGSGKSTLLHLLGGLEKPSKGQVFLDGVEITSLSNHQTTLARREKTGFVFQFFNLIPNLTAYENMVLPLMISGKPIAEYRMRLAEIIKELHLVDLENRKPYELSGGEQQRVALARAMLTQPAIVLADEPTGNLDYASGRHILDQLRRSCDRWGQTMVMVTHDAKTAAYADRVLVLWDGKISSEVVLGQRSVHDAGPLIARLQELGL